MRNSIQKLRCFACDLKGSAMLEFSIGAMVLALAFLGAFQFGYAFMQYNNLENAVARGAHYAALIDYDSASDTPSSTFTTAVQNMVLYGSPTAGTNAVVTGLTSSNVSVTACGISTACPGYSSVPGVPQEVTVKITGYSINAGIAKFSLSGKPSVTFAYQGIWEPI